MRAGIALALLLLAPPAGAATADAPADTLERVVPLPEIVVSTARAGERAPLARSVLGREAIARLNWGQDTPMALATLPGVYAYSDAGSGIGYSYLSIRGFPQRRISVLVNGVPLNDPESHEVFWIDHPDLLSSTAEVQVQRGVGSALYGAAAVGGMVNIETSPFTEDRRVAAALAYGSYRTRRAMTEMNSGRLAGGWNLYGRYSRIETDGYRDQSWSRLWSYTFSARKLAGSHSLRVTLYGGPEETHLAYKGVPRSDLEGGRTGSAERDRRHNPLTYPGETDRFFEPHYELLHSWAPRPGLTLTQTLFYFDGRGRFEERRAADTLSHYRLDTLYTTDGSRLPPEYYLRDGSGNPIVVGGVYRGILSDVVRRRSVANRHFGWIPRVRLAHPGGELIAGGEIRAHDGHHFGEVTGGNGLPPGTASIHRYFDYHPRTLSAGLFLREEWRPLPALTLTGDLAWRHQGYALRGDRFGGLRFDQRYDFALPRVGATWRPLPGATLFASWARAEREPRFLDLFNAEAAGSVPRYRRYDPATGSAEDPLVRPEKVDDFEAGATFASRGARASANLFHMSFRDELVDFQFDSNLGTWGTTNAARSVHRGVELALAAERRAWADLALALEANATLSNNHFVTFRDSLDAATVVRRDGNTIGFFPEVMANVAARAQWKGARLGIEAQHVGRIFLDQAEDPAGRIAPRTVLNLTAGWGRTFAGGARATLDVRILNALDLEYETGGYFDYDEAGNFVAHFVPAAKRNAIAELRVEF